MKNTIGKVKGYPFVPEFLHPNLDQYTRIARVGYVLSHGMKIVERYVTTKYRLRELHLRAWG